MTEEEVKPVEEVKEQEEVHKETVEDMPLKWWLRINRWMKLQRLW